MGNTEGNGSGFLFSAIFVDFLAFAEVMSLCFCCVANGRRPQTQESRRE